MNDFTKEELEQISFCLYAYPHSDDDWIYVPIRAKIRSMIDNYCVCKNKEVSFGNGVTIICSDCKKIYGELI